MKKEQTIQLHLSEMQTQH